MDIILIITDELQVKRWQVEAAVRLIDEGNTIPFISRYRKEATGALDDTQLRRLGERLSYLRGLEERKQTVLSAIEEQGRLTAELRAQIDGAKTLVAVEDLYRPYKQKKRTRATVAKERGLEGLAAVIRLQQTAKPLELEAEPYISAEKEVCDAKAAIAGAMDIISEEISDNADYRTRIRELTFNEGFISSAAKDADAPSVYEMYYDFTSPLSKMTGYRTLALNRGEKEKFLNVKIEAPTDKILAYLEKQIIVKDNPNTAAALKNAVADSYSRLIAPSVERELRSRLTEAAEDGAIDVFRKNLSRLLMQPPISGRNVLGWDPAFRTGCKLAAVDSTGKVLDTVVIYPTAPQNRVDEAKAVLKRLIRKYNISLISCGNGTASRESEAIIAELIKEIPENVRYVIVNEAGASVYSASELAAEEFPSFDVGQRSAASIARRLLDPLAELVKIDPKAIGVGQYQHDMNQKKLGAALDGVVEDCVNRVGVDLNTASAPLLEHISGVTKQLARNIVAYREANGRFVTRKDLLKVPKLGPKAFEQCAGFMRINGGGDPLDATGVHPESYGKARALLESMGFSPESIAQGGIAGLSLTIKDYSKLAAELDVGELTLRDIVKELEKPARDPREEMPKPILHSDVMSIEDLRPGMILSGTVRNVIDFGAFVDIGVHRDGLVHISQLTDAKFVKHPLEVVSVGDIVQVRVLNADPAKKRIQLSMIL
ncbi:MAG: RNA-binding transcriptional accessory protein [Butyrivibrio sp.]|nr:RNA-binding transcriptional accessory protein [Butyrivibrio sp.]